MPGEDVNRNNRSDPVGEPEKVIEARGGGPDTSGSEVLVLGSHWARLEDLVVACRSSAHH